jgi:hypothetical protein
LRPKRSCRRRPWYRWRRRQTSVARSICPARGDRGQRVVGAAVAVVDRVAGDDEAAAAGVAAVEGPDAGRRPNRPPPGRSPPAPLPSRCRRRRPCGRSSRSGSAAPA